MSRLTALACALSCAFATLAVAPAAHADGAGPVRILIIGDSLTLGRHGMYTWRYRLDKEFHRQGVAFDFVGSRTSTYVDKGYPAPRYADPNFDQNHFCKSGWWLRDAIVGGTLGGEVAAQNPDVVVFELGGADLTYGDSPEVTTSRLRSAIAEMRAAKPTIRIIIPKTTTKNRSDPSVNDRTNRFNAGLPQVVADLSTTESPITVADTMAGWTPNAIFTMDGSHLSPTGETLYAQRVAEDMHADGILPQAPQIYHGYVPWKRTVPLTVKGNAGHIQASWSRETVTSGQVRWRRSGSTSAWRTSATYAGGKVTWSAPPGYTYDVQLKIRWYLLTGPWGATSRVTVPRATHPAAPAHVTVRPSRVSWSASAGATSYVVKYRRAHGHKWIRRHTRAVSIRAAHATVAEVRAVNAVGTSGWRLARRAPTA